MARTEFSDALRGVYRDVDEVNGDEQTVDYKEVNALSILSVVLAVISGLGFFFKPFILLAAVSFALGFMARLTRIRQKGESPPRDPCA